MSDDEKVKVPRVPKDYEHLAEKYVTFQEALYLSPIRRTLGLKLKNVVKKLALPYSRFSGYETLGVMVRRADHNKILDYYMNVAVQRGMLTPSDRQHINMSNARILTFARILKLKLAPHEVLKFKRDTVKVTSQELSQMLHISRSTVLHVMHGDYRGNVYDMVKAALYSLEREKLQNGGYDDYY